MINFKEFEIIKNIIKYETVSPEKLYQLVCYDAFKDENEIKCIMDGLEEYGYLKNGEPTKQAMMELKSCKVKNAIILAAGGDDISSKSTYSMPKGLFVKNGETLIERQIRQLKEVGIENITVVIGYKQELYFFLEKKWCVNLEVNPNYRKNNIFSLYTAKKHLSRTYICNCDNYFEENPFSEYEFSSFHSTVYKKDAHNELLVKKNDDGRLLEVFSNGKSGECLYGHAYMDAEFSARFINYLNEEISDFRISSLFWEEFVAKHIDNLDMFCRVYADDFVFEFDQIQQIQHIDGLFLNGISHEINQKICSVLCCQERDIGDIVILEKGLTNILFTFRVKGNRYIFRYPGESSSFFIYRKNECIAQQLAAEAGADGTYIYIDENGIKISKYRENCIDLTKLYYQDVSLMKQIARKIKAFHEKGYQLKNPDQYLYDPIVQCEKLFTEASKTKGNLFKLFEEEWDNIRKLKEYADMDGIEKTMCHNDINADNILLTNNTLDIIDWEFAGYNDPGYDFGRVIAGLEYSMDDNRVLDILEAYFGRPATEIEHLHFMAYAAIHNWYYVGWALYKESINESSREWMLFFYNQACRLIQWCVPKYVKRYGKI